MRRWRKARSRSLPGSSSPTTPTGRTVTPRSARLQIALAAPPGTTLRSRCFRISTGASRETREISPKMNSSATRSPRTVTVVLGNASTILRRRSFSLTVLAMMESKIFSRARLSFRNSRENCIDKLGGTVEREFQRGNRQGLKVGSQRSEIDSVFFGGQEPAGAEFTSPCEQALNVTFTIRMVVAEDDLGGRYNASGTHLGEELFWASESTECYRRWRDDRERYLPRHPPYGPFA